MREVDDKISVVLLISAKLSLLRKLVPLRIKLGRDVYAFSSSVKASVKKVLSSYRGVYLLDSSLSLNKCENQNVSFLKSKHYKINVNGKFYSVNLYDELNMMMKWKEKGVHSSETREYKHRAELLNKNLSKYVDILFNTPLKIKIMSFLSSIHDINRSPSVCEDKYKHLILQSENKFDDFRVRLVRLLHKPREFGEIIKLMRVNESNARRWLLKLVSLGIVVRAKKRGKIGRPKNIYFLSAKLNLDDEITSDLREKEATLERPSKSFIN